MRANFSLSLASLFFGAFFLHAADTIEDRPSKDLKTHSDINKTPQRNVTFYTKITESNKVMGLKSHYKQGYLIESGQFLNKQNKLVSFVIVISGKGEITAIVERPQKVEIITLSASGKIRVINAKNSDFTHVHDYVEVDEKASPAPRLDTAEIEFLAAYGLNSLTSLNLDPVAYALAQLETARQGLSNSKVTGIELVLGAVTILNTGSEYNTTIEGLRNWQNTLEPYRVLYHTDINFAITEAVGAAAGMAFIPGWQSVNGWDYPLAFRHELGHNAAGFHCFPDDHPESYRHGYDNGRSRTILCGNSSPYYSNLNVVDDYGLPLGNAAQANMAKVWQEQASRMANYNTPLDGYKFIFTSVRQTQSKIFTVQLPETAGNPAGGFVALSSAVGPTELEPLPSGGYTTLNVRLRDMQNVEHNVVFRAERNIDTCPYGPMNRNVNCATPIRTLHLVFTYYPADNASLPAGTYNGLLQLRAKEVNDASFNPLVNLPLSIVK